MEVSGQALNHSKLAALVSRLIDQPEISDVQILKTALRTYTSTEVIDFDLAITVDSRMVL